MWRIARDRKRWIAALAAAAVLVVGTGGCGAGGEAATQPTTRPPVVERVKPAERKRPPAVTPSHCQAGLPACQTTEGLITFVERVDADGDGDAHFVVLDSQSITLPGLTAIDVSKELRPDPLPGVGDMISAAGPVQTGSYGQSQIHALELHVAGR